MKYLYNIILRWIKGEMHLIEQHSQEALNSFQSTLDSLKEVEAQIDRTSAKKQAIADKLAMEVAKLSATKLANSKIADKINSFLHD